MPKQSGEEGAEQEAEQEQEMETIEVEIACPDGCGPGDTITVDTPGGEVDVEIPDGVQAGDAFSIRILKWMIEHPDDVSTSHCYRYLGNEDPSKCDPEYDWMDDRARRRARETQAAAEKQATALLTAATRTGQRKLFGDAYPGYHCFEQLPVDSEPGLGADEGPSEGAAALLQAKRRRMYTSAAQVVVHTHLHNAFKRQRLALIIALHGATATREYVKIQPMKRMDWQQRVDSLCANGRFARTYRLPLEEFNQLVDRIRPHMPAPAVRGDGWPLELMLSITLRMLAGGSPSDIAHMHGMYFETQLYPIMHKVCEAIVKVDHYKKKYFYLKEPFDTDRLKEVAAGFDTRCDHMPGCVSAIDGLQVPFMPRHSEIKNPKSAWNRKGFSAINVQAGCDSQRRFNFVSIKFLGSCHDAVAFRASAFGIELYDGKLPSEFYVVLDDAYLTFEQAVTPYPGTTLRASPRKHTYALPCTAWAAVCPSAA